MSKPEKTFEQAMAGARQAAADMAAKIRRLEQHEDGLDAEAQEIAEMLGEEMMVRECLEGILNDLLSSLQRVIESPYPVVTKKHLSSILDYFHERAQDEMHNVASQLAAEAVRPAVLEDDGSAQDDLVQELAVGRTYG